MIIATSAAIAVSLLLVPPNRREDIVRLGAKTLVSGTPATPIAGSAVGMLV